MIYNGFLKKISIIALLATATVVPFDSSLGFIVDHVDEEEMRSNKLTAAIVNKEKDKVSLMLNTLSKKEVKQGFNRALGQGSSEIISLFSEIISEKTINKEFLKRINETNTGIISLEEKIKEFDSSIAEAARAAEDQAKDSTQQAERSLSLQHYQFVKQKAEKEKNQHELFKISLLEHIDELKKLRKIFE
jgi:hypothetical protein